MAINYTQDQVEYIVNQYRIEPTRETVEELAEEVGLSESEESKELEEDKFGRSVQELWMW